MTWSVDDEIKLFSCLMTFKPVGLDRNFQMICLAYQLQVREYLNFSVNGIWKRLSELYNLEELVSIRNCGFFFFQVITVCLFNRMMLKSYLIPTNNPISHFKTSLRSQSPFLFVV